MNLHRTKQILGGTEFHYVLINKFKSEEEFSKNFPVEFLKSSYFKQDAQIDSKKLLSDQEKNEYLPFPFNTDEIKPSDFREIKSVTNDRLEKELIELYVTEYGAIEAESDLDNGFKHSINLIKEALSHWTLKSDYFILTIVDFENKSKKIHPLYHDTNFIHGYFYFLIGINSKHKEVITCELGYE